MSALTDRLREASSKRSIGDWCGIDANRLLGRFRVGLGQQHALLLQARVDLGLFDWHVP